MKALATGQTPQRRFADADGELALGRAMPRGLPPVSTLTRMPTRPPPPAAKPELQVSREAIKILGVHARASACRTTSWTSTRRTGCRSTGRSSALEGVGPGETRVAGGVRLRYEPRAGITNRANVYVRDRAGGTRKVISVLVDVLAEAPPRLSIEAEPIDFGTIIRGTRHSRSLRFANAGGGQLDVRAASDHPSIYARVYGDVLEIGISRSATGLVQGTVRVESAGGGATIAVVARVNAGPVLHVDPKSLDLGDIAYGGVTTGTIRIANLGSGQLSWQAVADHTPGSGLSTTNDQVTITFRGAQAGPMRGTVRIESNAGTAAVALAGSVRPPPPAPMPPAPPVSTPPTAAPLAGQWAPLGGIGIVLRVAPMGAAYAFQEVNMIGVVLTEGTISPTPMGFQLRGYNMMTGPVQGTFTLVGAMLSGFVVSMFGSTTVTYLRM